MKIFCSFIITAMLSACASTSTVTDVHDQPLSIVTRLAASGDAEAVHDLCYRFKYGRGASLNYQAALKWCREGAALDIDSSQVLLAEMYYNGQGTPVNFAEALNWYQAAAAQGHEHALLMLYHMYSDGSGTPRDRKRALSYLQKAADAGYQLAIDEIAKL